MAEGKGRKVKSGRVKDEKSAEEREEDSEKVSENEEEKEKGKPRAARVTRARARSTGSRDQTLVPSIFPCLST